MKWSVNLVLLLGKRLLGKQRWALAENDPHAVIVLGFFFFLCVFESFRPPLRDENKGGEMARANASAREDYLNHTATYSYTDSRADVFQWACLIEVVHACGTNLNVASVISIRPYICTYTSSRSFPPPSLFTLAEWLIGQGSARSSEKLKQKARLYPKITATHYRLNEPWNCFFPHLQCALSAAWSLPLSGGEQWRSFLTLR